MAEMKLAGGRVSLLAGDCIERMRDMEPCSVDAVVTDPPYELGFMGKHWDKAGVAFDPATWAAVLRVLKPGGHLVAFSGTRTYHRMVCAIEDAGFEIRDQLAWVFGSGFPKSHNISKSIDRMAGAEREVVGSYSGATNISNAGSGLRHDCYGVEGDKKADTTVYVTAPATDAARQWEGWGTALKPAYEPVLLCAKPLQVSEHLAICFLETDARIVGWLHSLANDAENSLIDSRAKLLAEVASVLASAKIRSLESIGVVPSAAAAFTFSSHELSGQIKTRECSALSHVRQNGSAASSSEKTTLHGAEADISTRIMDMSMSAMMGDISENTAALWLSILEESCSRLSTFTIEMASRLTTALKILNLSIAQSISADTGNLSPNATPIVLARKPLSEGTIAANVLKNGVGALNIDACRIGTGEDRTSGGKQGSMPQPMDWGKETRRERPTGGRWPANLCHSGEPEVLAGFPQTKSGKMQPTHTNAKRAVYGQNAEGGYVTMETYGDGGSAARFFYCAKANAKDRAGSKHPTVKPVSLMRWLVRMVTPPGGTVLDPFAGTGTTGQAAIEEGFRAVLIEREEEYRSDIERRLSQFEYSSDLFAAE